MSLTVSAPHRVGYDADNDPLLVLPPPSAYSGIRLPDGRALAWQEYGDPRGVPCLLIPDVRSSRLAPKWLLHDTALPDGVRLIAIDRPGTGASDPAGGRGSGSANGAYDSADRGGSDIADDLSHLVQTLAVGQVVVIGIGRGADAALALAERRPTLVSLVTAVAVRAGADPAAGHHHRRSRRFAPWHGPLHDWARAAGRHDLTQLGTWGKAREQMTPISLTALGSRWHDRDFRGAVAADLALSTPKTVQADGVHGVIPDWVSTWTSGTPVRCWHGSDELDPDVTTVRGIAAGRTNWTVTAVPGGGPLLGAWPAILAEAREHYLRTLSR